jgi:hypothetical protein
MTGDMNLSQFFNATSGGFSTSPTQPIAERTHIGGGPRATSSQRMQHLSEGGIAMTRMRTELAEREPEAVVPLSKLAAVLGTSSSPVSVSSSSSVPTRAFSVQKLAEKLEIHVHTTAQTLDETAQDELMAQLLDIFTKAVNDVNGKLS